MSVGIEYFTNPEKALSDHRHDFRVAGADAFGRSEDFYEDVDDHFLGAEWGQILIEDEEIVGFSLYSNLPRSGVHLEGIAIKKRFQGRKIAKHALEVAAKDKYFQYVTATTRNPATVRLMGSVARFSAPDIRLDEPHYRQNDFLVVQAGQEALKHLNPKGDISNFPYLIDRYPDNLYGTDPGEDMPLELIRSNPRNAVVVAAIL